MSKRGTSNPSSRPANPCVVEYLGQNFAGKGTMTDLSGDGMKILGTHTGMRLALQLLVDEFAIPIQRGGPIRLNSSASCISGVAADSHAASLPVGSITAYASSGVCLPRLECGLDWLYQPIYCVIDCLASVTES